MSGKRLTIWCNAKWNMPADQLLRAGLNAHKLLYAGDVSNSVLVGGGNDPQLSAADVAFGQPDPKQLIELPNVRWTQLTSAGYTRYDNDEVRTALRARGANITNSSSVFDEPCAEHVVSMMYALARRLPESLDLQLSSRDWMYLPIRARSKLLVGQSVLLIGFGAIARRMVELLSPLRMHVVAVRRKPSGKEPVRTYSVDSVDELLPRMDHVVNILPESSETDRFFDARRLALLKPTANFYNIGRGTTVDQDALIAALNAKQLAAAYLDVFDPEPLPSTHPLWTTENCFITPHTGGGHHDEQERLVEHFLGNLKRFEDGQPLVDVVI